MRTAAIVGNWKMNLGRAAAATLARELRAKVAGRDVEVGVAPPFPYLEAVAAELRGSPLFVAGQNLHPEKFGAFTGEVSAEMLRDVGCTHVIVGHSERRHLLQESSEFVGRKVKSALAAGPDPDPLRRRDAAPSARPGRRRRSCSTSSRPASATSPRPRRAR